jgi:hypothetical protein
LIKNLSKNKVKQNNNKVKEVKDSPYRNPLSPRQERQKNCLRHTVDVGASSSSIPDNGARKIT